VLPYVIGRATTGNITALGFTDADGEGDRDPDLPRQRGRYGGRRVGAGVGQLANGIPKVVSDAGFFRFAGIGPRDPHGDARNDSGEYDDRMSRCASGMRQERGYSR
jgi:hypothetical protein